MEPGIQVAYTAARLAGRFRPRTRRTVPLPARATEPGLSVVIPSRNGKELLAAQMPGILQDLTGAAEVVVVDNGSNDGTAAWLNSAFPQVRLEISDAPLSFARAANRGIEAARYSRICLLNNDMLIDPGFFGALRRAFDQVPDLFSATAQIRFPVGVRREETGKAVMAQDTPEDFPLRCDEPVSGEDLTYVLYGSGGCSLYDADKLRALGGLDTVYEPAYVEDLDLGFRAWQRSWPSVYVAAAGVEHRHRATTSRYYTRAQLDAILEGNYLRFLARSVWARTTFHRLWVQALKRLRILAAQQASARLALEQAARIAFKGGTATRPACSEELVLALTNGTVFVFPGRQPRANPRVVVGLMPPRPSDREDRDEILVTSVDDPASLEPALLQTYVETVVVRRVPGWPVSFRAALEQSIRKWQPDAAELDRAHLASYAQYCASVRVNLV